MYLSREECRALDRRAMQEFGMPGVVLMENAGRGVADLLLNLGVQGPVAVCCGRGNNGGDGFVIARRLDNAGIRVRVLLFDKPADLTDAAVFYAILTRSGVPIRKSSGPVVDETDLFAEFAMVDWIVDALFGSGLHGPVKPPFDKVISAINASHARVLAVDTPSGLDADSGQPMGPTVRAHHTATIATLKKGFLAPDARNWLGQVHVIDMGAPRRLMNDVRSAIES
jgi:NAD(P)H-hydrate epimerase